MTSSTKRADREAVEEVRLACNSLRIYHPETDMDEHNKRAALHHLFWAGYNVGRYYPQSDDVRFTVSRDIEHESWAVYFTIPGDQRRLWSIHETEDQRVRSYVETLRERNPEYRFDVEKTSVERTVESLVW